MTFIESEAGTDRTRERMYRQVQQGAGRSSRISLAAAIIAIGTFILVFAYSAYQVTAPARTQVILERGVASVTDIDAYLAENIDDLREQANQVEPGASVLPPLFPVPISLTAEEVQQSSDLEIRNLLLARAANAVQEEGLAAFDQSGNQSFGFFSVEGVVDNMIGFLTGSSHRQAGVITVAAALVVALAGAIIAASDLRPGVIKTIGGAIAVGAFGGFLLSAAFVFIFSRAGGDPFTAEIAGIATDVFEVPRRNFFIVAVFGALLYGGGIALNYIERRAARELYHQDIAYQRGDPLEGGTPAFEAYDADAPWEEGAPAYYSEDGHEYGGYDDDAYDEAVEEPSPARDPGRFS